MVKCNPSYKNLNEIQSFSNQGYATLELMKQACMNDEYLKKQVEELSYLTPPPVRKRFSPILLDAVNSWGCQVNNGEYVSFSSETTKEIIINFSDTAYINQELVNDSMIDEDNSDCDFETYVHNDGTVQRRACVPHKEIINNYLDCRNHEGGGLNSYWYVGYDKAKTYEARPEWVKNWKDTTIPSVCRAQTITIPPDGDGFLESVDLQIENTGSIWSQWGSPLYVQIWKTKLVSRRKTYWDKKTKTNKRVKPEVFENVYIPDGDPYTALATASFQPSKITPSWQNFKFDRAVEVKAGERYAIVMLSPMSHPDHCPRIGGWGRNCSKGKYSGGDAFLSENNGRSWARYGKNAENLKHTAYKYGKYTPEDFAFQCHIKQYDSSRDTGEQYYLYLKPIHANPTRKVEINAICEGDENNSTQFLVFEVSSDGVNWTSIGSDFSVHFNRDSSGEYPHIIYVRARMESLLVGGSTTTDLTPYIEKMKVTLTMEAPSELYARTHAYNPKTTPMLGAAVWGRVYAPFEVDPTVEGSVEIIRDKIVSESFTIIDSDNFEDYVYREDGVLKCIYPGVDADQLTDENIENRYQYLMDNPDVINIFKNNNVYIKPYTYTNSNEEVVTDMMSFKDGIKFINSPAYPILECSLETDVATAEPVSYKEWVDYKFDYDNDILNFYYEEDHFVIDNIPTGSLRVAYNPIFIQDLTNNEVGYRGKGDEGLILDYFKETFIIGDEEIESRKIPLRCDAVDPLRKVLLNDEELFEDTDFTVDYINNELVFPVEDVENSRPKYTNGDILSVVYTPNLEDTSICIGYRAKRTSKDKDIRIKSNYMEYKA